MIEVKTVYFDKPGEDNTDDTLRIARKRAEELGIKTILVASTRGETAVKAVEALKGFRVVCVSHSMGFTESRVQKFTAENRKKVEAKGGIVLSTTHAFAGLSRMMRTKFNTYTIGDIIATTLRVFGEGMKVVCEIEIMAADSGLVSIDEDVIAIAGTGRGCDTAVVLKPAYTQEFNELRIKEVLCKPHF